MKKLTRRSFFVFSATALASLSLPASAFGEEASTEETSDSIIIIHTNDVHCAVDSNLGYAKLAHYVKTAQETYGQSNVILVDSGDAVQGAAMGTLTKGEYLVDIMNECGYSFAIPGNHEFDFGMTQFDTLVALSEAQYLSCNFTDLRTDNLRLSPYEICEYPTSSGTVKVAFLGICTPETLTASSPATFQDDNGSYIYGFCQDDSGEALYAAVQSAVDDARNEGADYVIAMAHLGQSGSTPQWRSDAVAANTSGIDAIIDGHSHEEYVQSVSNKDGELVLITQTGTKLVCIGTITIDPQTNALIASTPSCTGVLIDEWDGSDEQMEAYVVAKQAEVAKITDQIIGTSEVDLFALEDDGYTWAVRKHETNMGDFVADAYLTLAWHSGVMADVAFINGGGIRANIAQGEVSYGDVINVQPYSNQLCYVETLGQNILDALEMGARDLPEASSSLQHVSGLTYTVRTDIPSSVIVIDNEFSSVSGEYRVRDVMINDQPLDVTKTYKLVSHTFMITDGGDGMIMFKNDNAILLDLDNVALIEYLQYDLLGTIGQDYADPLGQGRITLLDGPVSDNEEDEEDSADEGEEGTGDTESFDDDTPSSDANDDTDSDSALPPTGDGAGALVAAAVAASVAAVSVAKAAQPHL